MMISANLCLGTNVVKPNTAALAALAWAISEPISKACEIGISAQVALALQPGQTLSAEGVCRSHESSFVSVLSLFVQTQQK